jgi:hypothetical protein
MTEKLMMRFVAKDDQDRPYTFQYVKAWKETTPAADGTTETIKLADRLRTADGQAVNRLAKGEYQIVPTGGITTPLTTSTTPTWRRTRSG